MRELAPYFIGIGVGALIMMVCTWIVRRNRRPAAYKFWCWECKFWYENNNADKVVNLGRQHQRFHDIEKGKP